MMTLSTVVFKKSDVPSYYLKKYSSLYDKSLHLGAIIFKGPVFKSLAFTALILKKYFSNDKIWQQKESGQTLKV